MHTQTFNMNIKLFVKFSFNTLIWLVKYVSREEKNYIFFKVNTVGVTNTCLYVILHIKSW